MWGGGGETGSNVTSATVSSAEGATPGVYRTRSLVYRRGGGGNNRGHQNTDHSYVECYTIGETATSDYSQGGEERYIRPGPRGPQTCSWPVLWLGTLPNASLQGTDATWELIHGSSLGYAIPVQMVGADLCNSHWP